MDMNGPLVPEKVLKSIQVCGIYSAKDFMLQCVCSVKGPRQHQNMVNVVPRPPSPCPGPMRLDSSILIIMHCAAKMGSELA